MVSLSVCASSRRSTLPQGGAAALAHVIRARHRCSIWHDPIALGRLLMEVIPLWSLSSRGLSQGVKRAAHLMYRLARTLLRVHTTNLTTVAYERQLVKVY